MAECPTGDPLFIPKSGSVPPDQIFQLWIDFSQYDGDPYVDQAVDGVTALDWGHPLGPAVYIQLPDPEFVFR